MPEIVAKNTLSAGKDHAFTLTPSGADEAHLAEALNVPKLTKLRFTGKIVAEGKADWRLTGQLGATVEQACVVTLDPVKTRIDTAVTRLYLAELPEFEADSETEMDWPDEDADPLGEGINLTDLMLEVIALNIPAYPRRPDAELGEAIFTEPGKAPLSDEDVKPFAGLADLKAKLEKDGD